MHSNKQANTNYKNNILQAVHIGNITAIKDYKSNYPNVHWRELRYDKAGDTILHIAARLGHINIIEYLSYNYEPAIDIKNCDDKTALHEAAQFAQYEAIKILLNNNANVNALKRADWTPLMLACTKIQNDHKNNYRCVKLLLQHGSIVNYINKDGWSALHLICREGCCEILKLLIEYKADVFKLTNNRRSTLHISSLHGHFDIVKVLINLNLDVNFKDNCGSTALHEAVLGGNIEIVCFLLNKGADIHATNKSGFGVLHLAASVGNEDLIKYLVITLKVNVNSTSDSNFTPLHCAVHKKHENIVQLLISLGADINIRDKFNRCAYDYLK